MSKLLWLLLAWGALGQSVLAAPPPDPAAEAQPGLCGSAGSDRVLEVEHQLLYSDQEAANAAARALDPKQFRYTVRDSGSAVAWTLAVVHLEVPDRSALASARNRLDALAQRTGGRYAQQACRTE